MTPWTITCQVPLSMGFPRQEYCGGLLFSCPGDLPDPVTEPMSPILAGRFFTTEPPGKPSLIYNSIFMLVPHCLDYCGFINFEIRKG